ncbi:MAG: hypothetical protein WCE65_10210, partial [Methanoregula sp.]
ILMILSIISTIAPDTILESHSMAVPIAPAHKHTIPNPDKKSLYLEAAIPIFSIKNSTSI